MKFAVSLEDIAAQLFEIADQLWAGRELGHMDGFLGGDYTGTEKRRVHKLYLSAVTIYLIFSAIRDKETLDQQTMRQIQLHIEEYINTRFDKDCEWVEPVGSYLTSHDMSVETLAKEILDEIDIAFISTQSFESNPYIEIVSVLGEQVEPDYMYRFSRTSRIRFYIDVNQPNNIEGMVVVVI